MARLPFIEGVHQAPRPVCYLLLSKGFEKIYLSTKGYMKVKEYYELKKRVKNIFFCNKNDYFFLSPSSLHYYPTICVLAHFNRKTYYFLLSMFFSQSMSEKHCCRMVALVVILGLFPFSFLCLCLQASPMYVPQKTLIFYLSGLDYISCKMSFELT